MNSNSNEEAHGFASFTALLEDAEQQGRVALGFDERRNNCGVRTVRGNGGA